MTTVGRSVRVCNTETFVPVAASATIGAFSSASVPLIPARFSWLGAVASSFSKWRWLRLRILYLPTVGTTTTGRVGICLGYDTNDTVPGNMDQIIAGNRATFGPVWAGQSGFDSSNPFAARSDMIHLDVDVNKFDKPYYPYCTAVSFNAMSSTDKNIYSPAGIDLGLDNVGTALLTVGTLYASYEVELLEPVASVINN